MLGGPYGATLVPTSVSWSNRVVIMVTTHFSLLSGLAWALKRAVLAQMASFGVLGGNGKALESQI